MLKNRSLMPSIRDPFSSPFYKKFTAENMRNEVDILGAGGIPPDFSPDNIRKLYYEAEPILTSDNSAKRLIVYQKFLIWFEELQPKGYQENSPTSPPKMGTHFTLDHRVCHEEIPVVAGYANLSGFFVESRDLLYPLNHYNSNTMFLSSAADQGHSMQPSIDLSMAVENGIQSMIQNMQQRYFKIYPHQRSLVSETIFLDSSQQMERWRQALADAPVFFGDFSHKYRVRDKTSKEGNNEIWQIEDVVTKKKLVAKIQVVLDPSDIREVRNLSSRVFREANLLLRLKPAHVTPTFRELCFTGKAFIIVEEIMHAIRFSDWFNSEWKVEVGSRVNFSQVHNLLIDLTLVVLTFHSFNIAHGSMNKDLLYVKSEFPDEQESVEPTQMSPVNRSSDFNHHTESKDGSFHFKAQHTANFSVRSQHLRRESLGPMPKERVVFSTLVMSAARRRRFYILGLGTALTFDASVVSKPSVKGGHQLVPPSFGISPRKVASPSPRTPGYLRETSPETDVFDLGVLFFEILFGIDIHHATQHSYGIESEFVSLLLMSPSQAIFVKEPIYDVDDRVLHLVGRMLQPDKLHRPTMMECYEVLVQVCKNPEVVKSPATRKVERKISGFHSKMSLDSIFLGFENLAMKSGRAEGSLYPNDQLSCFSPTRSPVKKPPQASNFSKQRSFQLVSSPSDAQSEFAGGFSQQPAVVLNGGRLKVPPRIRGTEYIPLKVIPNSRKELKLGAKAVSKGNLVLTSGVRSPRLGDCSIDLSSNRSKKLVLNVVRSESPRRSTSNDSRRVCFLAREFFKPENKLAPKVLRILGSSSAAASHSVLEFTARRSTQALNAPQLPGDRSARSITKELDKPSTTPRKRRLLRLNTGGMASGSDSEGNQTGRNVTLVKLGVKGQRPVHNSKGN